MWRQRGVTLLETMMTLSIAAIMAVTGIPGMVNLVQDVRQDTAVYDMISCLSFTRSEAIKRRHRVTLCPSRDGMNCLAESAWELGWMVFFDRNGDGTVNRGETILQVHGPLHAPGTLRGGRKRITYQSLGFSNGYNDTLEYCDGRGNAKGKRIVISMQGRIRIQAGGINCT